MRRRVDFAGMSGKEYEQVAKEESVDLSTEGEEGEEGGCCGSVRGGTSALRGWAVLLC